MDAHLKEQVRLFFSPPTAEPVQEGAVSTLHLLRREIQECLIGRIVEERELLLQSERSRLFATTMVTFAGVDLLAKFTTPGGRRRDAVVAFLGRFALLKRDQAEAIWIFRNALTHSFGLHHIDNGGRKMGLWIYQADNPGPVVRRRADGWELSIDDLIEAFIQSIFAYHQDLETDSALQVAFRGAFSNYGTIFYRGPHIG